MLYGMKHNILTYLLALILCMVGLGCSSGIKPPRNVKPFERNMEVTAYCPCGKCCNWKRNWYGKPVIAHGPSAGKPKKVGITASGAKAKPGTIAADTRKYPFGTVMYVPGYGYGRVEDRGSAIKGEHIDLYYKKHKAALQWGRQQVKVRVWLPKGK